MIRLGKKLRREMGNFGKVIRRNAIYGLIGGMSIFGCAPPAQPGPQKPLTEEERLQSELEDIQMKMDLIKLGLMFGDKSNKNQVLLSQWALESEQLKYQIALAKAGRDRIDINIDNSGRDGQKDYSQQRQTKQSNNLANKIPYYNYEIIPGVGTTTPPSFACGSWKDENGDGFAVREELMNLKYYFNSTYPGVSGQYVLIGATWYDAIGKSILLKITNKKNNELVKVQNFGVVNQDGAITSINFLDKKTKPTEIKEYHVEWYLDGKPMPSREFNFIVEYNP